APPAAPAAQEVAPAAQEAAPAPAADITPTKQAAMETYADIAFASYEDSYLTALALQEAINTFVENPSAETHQAAKEAWLAAQEPYGQTEVYRFYGGPIDDADGPEGLLNAWPLDEAYVDYVEGDPDTGIINNPAEYPEITTDLLIELNQAGSEENVSTGYHAIEFLLWGQDFSDSANGSRPYTDYIAGAAGTAANPERRAAYLVAVTDLLVQHLTAMKDAWDPAGANNYRAEFLALDPDAAIQKMLTGMGVLSKSELAGERMFTAYDNQDQEDEHSCFSDNTHRDIVTNAQGIRNVYLGTYTRIDGSTVEGTGLQAVVDAVDPALNADVLTLSDTAQEQINNIYVPFDQAIVLPDERENVLNAVFTLQDQGDAFAQVASALGFSINTALPE
ncbi:MAG: peptidase m75, imelysin, partial [Chloroflexaceae bacterium]|nr:peptidase m75, imelysin [Chloroflexaceae bacterium]